MAEFSRSLQDYSPEDLKKLPYETLCALRRQGFAAHVGAMEVPVVLTTWAEAMTTRYGPTVKIWAHQVDWITALLIARYGEAVDHWPEAFSEDDVRRAIRWAEQHAWPSGTKTPG